MKFDFRHAAIILALGAGLASCSDNDNPAVIQEFITVTFEDTGAIMAGPTSYGANLYYGYDGNQYAGCEIPVVDDVKMQFGLNVSTWTNEKDFYGGGIVLSNWNYRSNPAGITQNDWWYTYENQCSVYNTSSVDGANQGAGAVGSNTFAVAFGYDGPESSNAAGRFSFTNNAEFMLHSIQVCNTSYTYGVLVNGNPFGNTPGQNIIEAAGWLKVEFYGFDANGNPTNGGRPVELYLADGRQPNATLSNVISRWTECDLTPLGKVNMVKVSFSGSDSGEYGLNTPTYVALDNLVINVTD